MTTRISRRRCIQTTAGVLLFAPSGILLARKPRRPAPYMMNEAEAVAAGRKLDIGSAKLEGPKDVEVSTDQTWTLVYTAGRAGIRRGGGIRVGMRHILGWARPQTANPKARGYFTVKAAGDAPVKLYTAKKNKSRFFGQYLPWQNMVEVTFPERGLAPGETLRLTYGDRGGGSPGIRVQSVDESNFVFKVYVDALGDDGYLPLAGSPSIEIMAAEPRRLGVVMPSDAMVGRPTWCLVRVEDRYGNPATRYRGTVVLGSTDSTARLPAAYTFTEADRGVHRFEVVTFGSLGTHTLSADDGTLQTTGNPVRVARTRPERLLLWGDLHGHTLHSDGRGTVEEFYDFAQRIAGLDFCAVSDHAFEITEEMWEHSKAVTNRVNQPGRFVTFHGYEWSGDSKVGGDHNVYFIEDDPPIYRSDNYYNPRNLQMYHGPEPKLKHVEEVFAKIEGHLSDKNVFCIPHYGGRRGNPDFHNPKVQRLIEIFSEHRRSEDWAADFLKKGYRLGIMASTDGHHGNPGYGYLMHKGHKGDKREIGMAAIAVYAPKHTRESIFHSLYDRCVYATTGDRIILDVRADGHPMGSEYRTTTPPAISVEAVGIAPITRVEIVKNSKVVYTHKPGRQSTAGFEWRDPDFQLDCTNYYYVRVIQDNNELAVSSPIWLN